MSEPCPAPAQLEQLLTGREDLIEAALEHHLEQCPRCQQKLDQLTASASSLGRRFRSAAAPPSLPAAGEAFVRRLKQETPPLWNADGPGASPVSQDPVGRGGMGAIAIASTASLVEALRQFRLLEPLQLAEVTEFLPTRFPDPKALARELIQRGWLTPYQANQLLQGRGPGLVLGSYTLLERVGEGGMGQVFKARHWKLGKVVALKLIRKERLGNPAAIKRFQREVRAVAALSHPNIVLAYDADQIGGTHLLVMEFVEGATDLARLVKKNGPLPIPQACDYIRQAALGLQHVYERGLVHRDIKPHNLLLAADGKTVKILDMGLARLNLPSSDDDKSSTVTKEGTVMGTPDYIAPEQALESHTVDIRADLYSLGCTFYHLLTDRVPFPGGSLGAKLLHHQMDEPTPVEQLRREVPPVVAAVVRKLMAKKPDDRYQTPAEVAVALASLSIRGGGPPLIAIGPDRPVTEEGQATAVAGLSGDTLDSTSADKAAGDTAETIESPRRPRRKTAAFRRVLFGLAGGSFVLVGVVILLFLRGGLVGKQLPATKKDLPAFVGTPSGKTSPRVDETWLKQVAGLPAEKQVDAVAAKLKELNPGFDGNVTPKINNGVVTEIQFLTDNVTDISPVQGLRGLKALGCSASAVGKGKLSDLSPLEGMPLTALWFYGTRVAELAPLKGMPVTDLGFNGSGISDLSPLQGAPLVSLDCASTSVSDLSSLKGMSLQSLSCRNTKVSDLSPLQGMPLKALWCDFQPERDAKVVGSIKTLEKINDKPAKEFWKEVDEKKP
jgi:serine/threonine protein kinase